MINHDFFKKWSPHTAYWLGFIAADGYVVDKPGYHLVGLELSTKDMLHLEKFKKALAPENKIYVRNRRYSSARVHVTSKEIVNDLINLQVGPRKNETMRLSRDIPDSYFSHYVRGYFDGDGCVQRHKNSVYVSMIGTRIFLEELKHRVEVLIKKNMGVIVPLKHTCVDNYVVGGNIQARRMLNWMYQNSHDDIRLGRKYSRYVDYLT